MSRLKGKVAIVTGGARGQGRSHAMRMAQEGASIVVCDLARQLPEVAYPLSNEADLKLTVDMVEEIGGHCIAVQADVRSTSDMERVATSAIDAFGQIDILIANAAVGLFTENTWELSEEEWDLVVDINMKGVWLSCKAVIPKLIEKNCGGSIIITSSNAGLRGFPHLAHYVAAKHGVVGLMRTLARELAPYNIRVNTVHPNATTTPMIMNEYFDNFVAAHPKLGESGPNLLPVHYMEPVDISNAMVWLASDEARYVTGITLPVDGGSMAK